MNGTILIVFSLNDILLNIIAGVTGIGIGRGRDIEIGIGIGIGKESNSNSNGNGGNSLFSITYYNYYYLLFVRYPDGSHLFFIKRRAA